MKSNEYQFSTDWRVEASRELIYDIIAAGEEYPRWWPDVYLSVESEGSTVGGQPGSRLRLHTKGWLPYTLEWTAETVRAERPSGFEIRATGDFDGRGIWTFTQEGPITHAHFDWRLRADKPLLRTLSFALKPLFKWNHRWAMERGRERLVKEVARRLERGG